MCVGMEGCFSSVWEFFFPSLLFTKVGVGPAGPWRLGLGWTFSPQIFCVDLISVPRLSVFVG